MKKIIGILLLFFLTNAVTHAVEFDTSVDETIRKNYNVEYNELPALPKVVPTAEEKTTSSTITEPKYNPTGKTYAIKSGTKVNIISNKSITDYTAKGSIVSFGAKNGFTAKDGTIIPAGTIFKGKVTDSHPPGLTGNGGLIELCIDEIYFNGVKSPIKTKISIANSKKVFLGNIKGQRCYWKNYSKAMNPGRKVFHAAQNCASAMAAIPVLNLVSFIPLAGGAAVYGVNFITAPVAAIFTKGGNIALPAGTEFQIKITEDTEIRG